jgi:integrase/recombinase XerD
MSRPRKHKESFPAALIHARDNFLDSLRVQGAAAATLESRAAAVNQLLHFLVEAGVADVRAITRETMRAYQTWLQKKPYSPWTLINRIVSVRVFFAFLEKTDAVLLNPCSVLIMPRTGARLPRFVLTLKQVQRVLNAPDTQTKLGLRDRALLEMFYSTGLRCEEMTRLTVHDVDVKNGFARVIKGKGGKDRVVPMGQKAADYVAEYLKHVRAEWSKEQRDERALWLSSIAPHGPMKSQAIAVTVRNYLRAGGIAEGRAHVWRHTCATHLVAGGANIAYVQRMLGHKSLSTTQRYTRVAVPEVKRTYRRSHPRARSKSIAQAAPVAARGTIKGHYAAYDL